MNWSQTTPMSSTAPILSSLTSLYLQNSVCVEVSHKKIFAKCLLVIRLHTKGYEFNDEPNT